IAYLLLARYRDALDALEAGRAVSESIGDRFGAAYASNAMGNAYLDLAEPRRAARAFAAAIRGFRRLGREAEEGSARANLAYALRLDGRLAAAIGAYREALRRLHPEAPHGNYGVGLANLA